VSKYVIPLEAKEKITHIPHMLPLFFTSNINHRNKHIQTIY